MLLRKIYFSVAERALLSQFALKENHIPYLYGKSKCFFSTSIAETLHLSHHLKSNKTINVLNKKGINSFFPIQSKTFIPIFEGKDVIAGDKTGSGKTMAFTLPVIERFRQNKVFEKKGLKFVVLAPTRQLAAQIGNQVESLKHSLPEYRVLTVFGGTPTFLNKKQLQKDPDILVGTPGRIIDLMNQGLLNFEGVNTVCIDEADFMFDIGFKEHVDNILSTIKQSAKQKFQVLCFSATINKDVAQLTRKFMNSNKLTIKLTEDNETRAPQTIKHQFVQVFPQNIILSIRHLIKTKANNGRVIVFANTKAFASEISRKLKINNVVLHGDIEQRQRLQRLKIFKDGKVKVLIASDVAARGLDIPNVELVINCESPKTTDNYIHRSGRTGRAGKQGLCVTIIQDNERRFLRNVVDKANIKLKQIKISNEEYQNVENVEIDQTEQMKNQISDDAEYSKTQLVMFPKKYDISKSYLNQFLSAKRIPYKLKQLTSQKTGSKFFIVVLQNQEDLNEMLQYRVPSECGQGYVYFNRSKLRQFRQKSQK